jgi:hypothetical protein
MAIWGRLKKYLLRWPLYVLLVLFPILIGASQYAYREVYLSKKNLSLENTLKHWPKFIEDLKVLDTQNIARPIGRNKNAASFLVERISWDPEEENLTEARRPARRARALLRKYPKWGSDPEELAKLLADPELKKIDSTWVNELSRFDYLDFSAINEQKEQLDRLPSMDVISRIGVLAALPMPVLMEAVDLATVAVIQAHLAKAPREKQLSSLNMITQLFHLIQSSPTLVDQSTAVATLGRVQSLVDGLKIQGVAYVPMEMRLRIRRVSWMWAQVLALSSMKEFEPALNEVRPFMKTTNFLCGGSDPVGSVTVFRDILNGNWPFEPDFSTELKLEERFLKETSAICGTPVTDILLALPKPENNPMQLDLPYLRGIYFSILNSIAVPSYSRQYDDLEAESKNKQGL